MQRKSLVELLNPLAARRERTRQQQVSALRSRDGDSCRRCRRPMRFDLPAGHDAGAIVAEVLPAAANDVGELDILCLTHRRCHAAGTDHTGEVTERIRRKNEAELLGKARRRA